MTVRRARGSPSVCTIVALAAFVLARTVLALAQVADCPEAVIPPLPGEGASAAIPRAPRSASRALELVPLGGTVPHSWTYDVHDHPFVAAAPDERRVMVAWTVQTQDGDRAGFFGRLFDGATGQPVTSEFQINTEWAGEQDGIALAAVDSTLFVALWWSDAPTTEGVQYQLMMQLISAEDGRKVGTETRISAPNSHPQNGQSAALKDGAGAVFVYASRLGGEDSYSVLQVVRPNGSVTEPVRLRHENVVGFDQPTDVAVDTADSVLVAYMTDEGACVGRFRLRDGESLWADCYPAGNDDDDLSTYNLVVADDGTVLLSLHDWEYDTFFQRYDAVLGARIGNLVPNARPSQFGSLPCCMVVLKGHGLLADICEWVADRSCPTESGQLRAHLVNSTTLQPADPEAGLLALSAAWDSDVVGPAYTRLGCVHLTSASELWLGWDLRDYFGNLHRVVMVDRFRVADGSVRPVG